MVMIMLAPIKSANAITLLSWCGNGKTDEQCGYFQKGMVFGTTDSSNVAPITDLNDSGVSRNTSASACHDAQAINYCWIKDRGVCAKNDTGYDGNVYCEDVCTAMGYNVYVTKAVGTKFYWNCACAYDENFAEWRKYSTGVLRKYTQVFGKNCQITGTALNEYKCAPGYYGPNNSTTGCKICPANATCPGGTGFICNDGYYINSAGNGCIKCPDSKTGGLGWDANGNGVAASGGGGMIEYCAFYDGTVLYDTTGKFTIDGESVGTSDGCEYTK